MLLVRVRSGDEDDVGASFIFCCFGGFDAGEVCFSIDYFFAGEMAAAFGEELVFDVETCDVGADVLVYCCCDGDGT